MRVTVRAISLLIGVLIVGAVIEPQIVPATPSVAQEAHGAADGDVGAPFAPPVAMQVGTDGVAPTATPPFPLPTELRPQCPDPEEPVQPVLVSSTATPVPLYQPVPHSTGEFVMVSHTNNHGANLRVAPRALARVLRVVPEGEVLETVGGDLKVDRVQWAYVRDGEGTIGWIVAHMLTGVARVPGQGPLPFQDRTAAVCATFTPTPTPDVIQINVTTP